MQTVLKLTVALALLASLASCPGPKPAQAKDASGPTLVERIAALESDVTELKNRVQELEAKAAEKRVFIGR